MRLYLDTCSLHRIVDAKTNVRIILEAEAVSRIVAFCAAGGAVLLSSDVLRYEVERNPHAHRRALVAAILDGASSVVALTNELERRAGDLVGRGFKPLDALHLASAEAGAADFFCTSDDRLLHKAREQADLLVRAVTPLELAGESLP